MDDDQAALTARIPYELYRRVKIESVNSGQTLRELVQLALEDLLERRAQDRREAARGGF